MKLSCVVSQMLYISSFSRTLIQLSVFFYIQEFESGSSGWVADLEYIYVYILIGVCVQPYSVESVVSLGVVDEMKERLNEWRQPEWRMWFIKDTS